MDSRHTPIAILTLIVLLISGSAEAVVKQIKAFEHFPTNPQIVFILFPPPATKQASSSCLTNSLNRVRVQSTSFFPISSFAIFQGP